MLIKVIFLPTVTRGSNFHRLKLNDLSEENGKNQWIKIKSIKLDW